MRVRGLCRSESDHIDRTVKKEMYNKTEKASNSHVDHQRLTHTSFQKQPTGTQINAKRGSHWLSGVSHHDSCGSWTTALTLQVHSTNLIYVLHTIPESRLIEAASCLVSCDCTVPAEPSEMAFSFMAPWTDVAWCRPAEGNVPLRTFHWKLELGSQCFWASTIDLFQPYLFIGSAGEILLWRWNIHPHFLPL